MTQLRQILMAALVFGGIGNAAAEVTAEQAKQLGSTLTVWGAERAGNTDGSIPAYRDESITPPADFKTGSGRYPDPFKDDKPLYSITAANVDQYADKLSEGSKLLFKRSPSFRIDVYPTRRTMVYSPWVQDNTLKNATRAKLINDGMGVEGAYGGIPFPIPKNGSEVLWNNALQAAPLAMHGRWPNYTMDQSGRLNNFQINDTYVERPYYDPSQSSLSKPWYYRLIAPVVGPARAVGEANLLWYPVDYSKNESMAWIYTSGQRRVRLAPEAKYDTPIAVCGGYMYYDEISMFSGPPDRYDFKLLGKKEMVVPYNTYRAIYGDPKTVVSPGHLNPDSTRWELHRVWVVEATLKPGKRHAFPRRVFYADEDTWNFILYDGYDKLGNLGRIGQTMSMMMYEPGNGGLYSYSYVFYDLAKGAYTFFGQLGDAPSFNKVVPKRPENATSPDALTGTGIR